MNISLTYRNLQELIEELKQGIGTTYQSNAFEYTLELPARLGSGWMRSLHLQPGLDLHLQAYQFQEDIVLQGHAQSPSLGLSYCLNGSVNGQLKHPDADLNLKTGDYGLVLRPELIGERYYAANQVIQLVQIEMAADFLQHLWIDDLERVPAAFKSSQKACLQQGRTPAQMMTTLHQIWCCPYQGFTKRLYLESKALELVALQLENWCDPAPVSLLNAFDRDCINHAQHILRRNLSHPPSLMALARQVGLNDYKLKLGFRQMLGTTVFGYLHDCRIEQARQLLATQEMTVTQAMKAVGYSNRGHFAAAFKRRYGLTPKAFSISHKSG